MREQSNRLRFNSLLTFLIIVSLLLSVHLIFLFISDAERFPINTVKIVANYDHITREQLENVLNKYLQSSFFSLSIKHLQKDLLALDWMDRVYITRLWPDTLKVTLIEKIPIAFWNTSLITANGEIFNSGKIENNLQLVNLRGPEQQSQEVLHIYQKLSKLLSMYDLQMAQLYLHENQSWQLTLVNGIELRLGKKDIEKRLLRFCRSYPAIFDGKIDETKLVVVDLRYPRGMAIEWKARSRKK